MDSRSAAWRQRLRLRVGPPRSWGYVSWSPLIIDFGYLRYNRYWWHNVRATFALAYRLRYGHWPVYWYWDRKLPVPCDGTICCHGDTHEEGCARAR